MLTGHRAFGGEVIPVVLAAVLKSEPDWALLPVDTPAAVRRLLRRCLQKDPHQRLQHVGDARLEIDDAMQPAPIATAAHVPFRRLPGERLLWLSVLAIAAGAAALSWQKGGAPAAAGPTMRLEVSLADGVRRTSSFTLSPDGSMAVFPGDGERGPQLWVRDLAESAVRPLEGTEGGEYPFWSPDGRSIGFFASNRLKRVNIGGGPPQAIADVFTPAGGTWNSDGTILYVPNDVGGVFRVPAAGGVSQQITPQRSPELVTRLPQFLPDGRHFLFYVARGGEPPGLYIGQLDGDAIRRILTIDGPAVYGSGHLWFVTQGKLFAQQFDAAAQTVVGGPIHISDNASFGLFGGNVSAARSGAVAYNRGPSQSRRELIWFDRSGTALGTAGEQGALLSNPSLSPDGQSVVVQRTVQQNIDLWLLDLKRNAGFTRLTDDPGTESMPVWSPDGKRVVFSTGAGGTDRLAVIGIDGARHDGPDLSASGGAIACDWSEDGNTVLFKQVDQASGSMDLWAVAMEPRSVPYPVVNTPYEERDGQFSPDAKWIAYESNDSGRPEIYTQRFPRPGQRVKVSTGGGTQVRWRHDGKELFYVGADQRLMAVAMDPATGTPLAPAVPLFTTQIAPIRSVSRQQYVVSIDGQRFLIATTERPAVSTFTLLLNWRPPATSPASANRPGE
jgi:Tol biopolymer transport system component